MKIQVLIYPVVILAAVTVFLGAMGFSDYGTIAAALTFVATLFLLASIRRETIKPNLVSAEVKTQTVAATPAIPGDQVVIQFVRNLQERGRFLDFVMADIHTLPDAQVGAVARVVHSGLKSMINDYFSVEPISSANEGTKIAIPQDEVGRSYRLLQSSNSGVPVNGVLVHKGWQARAIKLPTSQRAESDAEQRILAFAEVDVKE